METPSLSLSHRMKAAVARLHEAAQDSQNVTESIDRSLENARSPVSPLYALIIGIDEYASKDIRNLSGAVGDARKMKTYLQGHLGVPESQICFLSNAQATREAIIKGLEDLVADNRIRKLDPIVIFYAGHGGETNNPWDLGSKIQMLIPHDFDGQKVHGIPDRTIGVLLSRMADKWDHNITVIFDCCHSASGTRRLDDPASGRVARLTSVPDKIPSNLDRNIWADWRGPMIPPTFLHSGLRSHILLAACGDQEYAYEKDGQGIFSTILLEALSRVNTQYITYYELWRRICPMLSLQNQSPQCEGHYKHRVLFSARALSRRCMPFNAKREGDKYIIDAGTARGIDIGDEFTLHEESNPTRKSPSFGTFVVSSAEAYQSMLKPLRTARLKRFKSAFAFQTKVGARQDLRVHIAESKKLTSLFEALEKEPTRPDRPRILRVEEKKADLGIDISNHIINQKVVFDVLDERVTKFNLRRIPFHTSADVKTLGYVLDGAARFYWHLRRTDEGQRTKLSDYVQLEVKEVVEHGVDLRDLTRIVESVGDDLIHNGIINLVGDSKTMYAIKIQNDSALSLHAALFYFNVNDLSIVSLYQPIHGGQHLIDPPLRPRGSIELGYGSGGEAPRIFTLMKGHDVEVGFLKLFLSTEYVDLSDIPQPSPFTSGRPLLRVPDFSAISTWDTVLVTVVVHKERSF